jgi:hypothetical protein
MVRRPEGFGSVGQRVTPSGVHGTPPAEYRWRRHDQTSVHQVIRSRLRGYLSGKGESPLLSPSLHRLIRRCDGTCTILDGNLTPEETLPAEREHNTVLPERWILSRGTLCATLQPWR